jgi:hypothetical protein
MIREQKTAKDAEESGCDLALGTIPVFSISEWGNP